VARFNFGVSTLHTRFASPAVVRAGVVVGPVITPYPGFIGIPAIPGSTSVSPQLIASCAITSRVDSDADRFPSRRTRGHANATAPACHREGKPEQRPTQRLPLPKRGQAVREPVPGQRWQAMAAATGAGVMCRQAILGPQAAILAAAGG
jgi:hypothetical protein